MSVLNQEAGVGGRRMSLPAMRLMAASLLIAMSLLYLVAVTQHHQGAGWGYLRAFAEAALVGGLADWFAVTAIFRQPLGLPIPHTAIVPKSKDRIAEGLAMFIEHNFLTAELIRAKLRSTDPARLLAEWLALPRNADRLAARLLRTMPFVLGAIDDRDLRELVVGSLGRQLGQIDLAPLLGRAVASLNDNGFFESLLDKILEPCRRFLEAREEQL